MAFLDRQSSLGGASSRTSRSGHSRASASQHAPSTGDMFSSAAPGVLSMLKTSTDVGDIGEFSFNQGRLPAMLRPAHQRRNHPARLSGSSNHTVQTNSSYTTSQVSKWNPNSHIVQGWDSVSAISSGTGNGNSGRHGSMVSLQTVPPMAPYDGRIPPPRSLPRSSPYGLTPSYGQGGRSYSMTQPQPPQLLKPAKSATSLRGQGQGPAPSQRPPYVYPSRLKRPGYRSPSPALSDYSGTSYQIPYGHPQAFSEESRYPIERLPSSLTHQHLPYGHLQGHPPRPLQMHPHGRPYGPDPGPHSGRGIPQPSMMTYDGEFAHGGAHVPRYIGNPLPFPRQPKPSKNNNVDPAVYHGRVSHARPGPQSGVGDYGAVLRAGTPQINSLPSSSEPSSSATQSSNPTTPRDANTLHVALEHTYGDSAYDELPNEEVDYNGYQSYLKYAEKSTVYELDAAEPAAVELEGSPPTVRSGFVQRIKNLLEDRAAGQESPSSDHKHDASQDTSKKFVVPHHAGIYLAPVERPNSKPSSLQEPYELEVPARITRTLIKANTAPSSSEQNTTTSLAPEDTMKAPAERDIKQPCPGELETSFAMTLPIEQNPIQEPSTDGTNSSEDPSHSSAMDFAVQIELPEPSMSILIKARHPKSAVTDQIQGPGEGLESGCVSPLRTEDKIIRDSVVSPMPTQTLQVTAIQEQHKVPGSYPKTSKLYGSPQLGAHLNTALENSDMLSGFSMPPEPSQVHDVNADTDAVTDVAMKFAVPRTSDHGKAQLVNLSALSGTPVKGQTEVKRQPPTEGNTSLNSFSSVERVAPLHIRKLENFSPNGSSAEGGDLSSFIRRSFPRKKSMQTDTLRSFAESSIGSDMLSSKPLPYLPGLKEDSKEDMSLSNLRSSATGLRFSVTSTSHLKTGYETLRHSEEVPRPSYLASRPPRMTLSELRNLPSLNFSRMDLIDKLNEALDTRGSRISRSLSLDEVRRRNAPDIHCPSPIHPASAEALRERYKSFFAKPDYLDLSEHSQDQELEATSQIVLEDQESSDNADMTPPHKAVMITPDIVSNFQLDGSFCQSVRPLSPEYLLSVASEANRLSVPSVAALSERLSELLPSIKHLNLDSVIGDVIGDDKALNDTIDEIHHLGHYETRPESEATGLVRSSTGLRQLAAAADNIATNGTHDSAVIEAKSGRLMKELPPLPEDTEKFSLSDSGLDRNTTLCTGTDAFTSTTELDLPRPALLRGKSLSVINNRNEDMHPGFTPKRSLVLSTQSLRPWNLDENYPWCGNSPAINITFPSPALRRHSSASEIVRISSETSSKAEEANKNGNDVEETTNPRSTLPSSPMLSSCDVVTPTTLASHGRKASKRSLIGSLSRRMGLSTRSHPNNIARERTLTERSHKPGDRYPYSGLLPPNNFNIDEVRSFFSDSTSEEHGDERRGSFRKHISSIRAKLPNANNAGPHLADMDRARSLDHQGQASRANASGSLFDDRYTEPIHPQNYDGMVGMGRVEFRVKRVAERLRHIWMKSGEMIRSFSQRNRPIARRQHHGREVERDDWLADSLYSGV